MTAIRYRLGAEELIELGRISATAADHRPFLGARARRDGMGQESAYFLDILGGVAGFIAEGLSVVLTSFGNLIDVPLQILAQGVDIVFNGIAGAIGQIPLVGELLGHIVLLGGALIKFGLSIPGLVLKGLGNVIGGVAKWMKGSASEGENQEKVDEAKEEVTDRAPDHIKGTVKAVLDASGVSGGDLAPNVDEDSGAPLPEDPESLKEEIEEKVAGPDVGAVLAVGIPVVGVAALIAALA